MMPPSASRKEGSVNWKRLAPLTGVVFVALLVASFIVGGNTPDSDASAQQVASFYSAHDTKESVSALLGGLATIFFLFFLGILRGALRRDEEAPGVLSTTALAGGVLLAVGGASFSGIAIALADNPDKIDP